MKIIKVSFFAIIAILAIKLINIGISSNSINDGDLIFQSLEVINDGQLEHALNKEFKVTKETSDTISNLQ